KFDQSCGVRFQFDRATKIERSAIECQSARCFSRGCFGMYGGAISFAGAEIVFIQTLRVIESAGFDRLRQPAMNLTALAIIEQRSNRLADAIVINLDAILRAAAANELRRAYRRQ